MAFMNEWRTLPDMDRDDIVQEGFFIYERLVTGYDLEGPGHLFSLYKVSLLRKINTFSSKRTRRRGHEQSIATYDDNVQGIINQVESALSPPNKSGQDDLALLLALSDAPPEIRKILKHVAGEDLFPDELHLRRLRRIRGPHGEREKTNQYFCRAAGLDPQKSNFIEAIRNWINGEPSCL